MATDLFPRSFRVGEVVNVTGPFAGLIQGQVRVRFTGGPWQSPSMMGPFSASVVVPEGAESGTCEVEIDGRQTFGGHCTVIGGQAPPGRHGGLFSRGQWSERGQLVGLDDETENRFRIASLLATAAALVGILSKNERLATTAVAVDLAIIVAELVARRRAA
jgi:hypothetical protein